MFLRLMTCLCLVSASLATAGIIDTFNRPDANTLGPNWIVVDGGAMIIGNRAAALNNAMDSNLAVYSGLSSSSAYVDVYTVGTSLQYIALALGYSSAGSNYFIKVQQQSSAAFNYYAFYFGNNAVGGLFHSLSTQFTSGRISVNYSGNTAYLNIDTNFDGAPEQQYSHTYASAVSGTGVGLGLYGAAQADNFGTGGAVIPEPGSWMLVLAGLGALVLPRLRRK
jgi:hypothetical protein